MVAKLREELAADLCLAVEEGLHEAGEVFCAEGTHRGGQVQRRLERGDRQGGNHGRQDTNARDNLGPPRGA